MSVSEQKVEIQVRVKNLEDKLKDERHEHSLDSLNKDGF